MIRYSVNKRVLSSMRVATLPVALLSCLFSASLVKAQDFPDGPGKDTTLKACGGCHGADVILSMKQSRSAWAGTIDQMFNNGLNLSDAEYDSVLNYLTKYFGTEPAQPKKINVNKATAKELETGLEISTKEAEAIVKYRDEHGNFKDWHDVGKVEGVDAKKIEAKKDVIEL